MSPSVTELKYLRVTQTEGVLGVSGIEWRDLQLRNKMNKIEAGKAHVLLEAVECGGLEVYGGAKCQIRAKPRDKAICLYLPISRLFDVSNEKFETGFSVATENVHFAAMDYGVH